MVTLTLTLGGVLRFKVPQNIDMQDRIVGPLTMIQFVYAVIGAGIAYALYSKLPAPLGLITAVPIVLFTAAVDFLKVNERPFLDFFFSAIAFASSPKQRLWHQGGDSSLQVEIYNATPATKAAPTTRQFSEAEIHQAASRLDSGAKLIRQ